MPDIKHGLEILRQNVKLAPEAPGVYRMISDSEEVLYVGKAKNIKKRIVAYTKFDQLPVRLQRMVAEVDRMEFIIVENEAKALLMENELIKRFSPRFNILLKDDKTFPHLMIDTTADFPALRKSRGKRDHGGFRYFGPFVSAQSVNDVMDVIQKAFRLRSCRDTAFANRERPCLLYQIKRCSAPCVGKISKEDYRAAVREVLDFLEGKNAKIQETLSEKMRQASENLDFETALVLRDRIRALSSVQTGTFVEYADLKSVDIIALARRNGMICIQLFLIRNGRHCGNVPYFPQQTDDASDAEILEAFISEFYADHQAPDEIFISTLPEHAAFLEEALHTKILTFQRGAKASLIDNAKANAVASIGRKMAQQASVRNNLAEMAARFDLPKIPERIEVYDNSHIQGSYAVGAMIVATPDGFDKKAYRTYNIKDLNITNDDFAMMKEVLTRRFEHLTPENRPDVILLDGGLGQLHAVNDCLKAYDLTGIRLIAISKGPERNAGKEFYHMVGYESFELPYRSSLAFYLQTIRDEAHRFAIGTHRKKRGKAVSHSKLDAIEGIGRRRKHDLLNYFGSVAQIERASLTDLCKIPGISTKTAEKIYSYFNKDAAKPL
jgi:excinuclease ABC subunit C